MTILTRTSRPILVGLALVVLAAVLQHTKVGWIEQTLWRLDAMVYDLQLDLHLRDEQPRDNRVLIVDVDEQSLAAEGQWPWPRDKVAQLVDRLFAHGVAVIGFDVVFAEAEANDAERVLARLTAAERLAPEVGQQLRENLALFDNNRILADSLRKGDTIVGFAFHDEERSTGELAQPLKLSDPQLARAALIDTGYHHTGNIAVIQQAAKSAGFFSIQPDRDGIVRRAPLILRSGDGVYPALSLEMMRLFYLIDEVSLIAPRSGEHAQLEAIQLGSSVTIPTDELGRAIIPFQARSGHFPYVSATDVLHGRVDPTLLQGAIVLVGATAKGLFDHHSTPMQAVFPGVEVQAALIAGMLDNSFAAAPVWAIAANLIVILILGGAVAIVLPLLPPLLMLLGGGVVTAALVWFTTWITLSQGIVLGFSLPFLLLVVLVLFNLAYGFFSEAHDRLRLKGMFGQYVPPELVEEMSLRPGNYGFDGDSREMTVLFSDIRSFTTISEHLDATQLKRLLNRFFTPMTEIIFNERGTIDKYVGDMVMAFWGAPLHDPQHATHAIGAALAMLAKAEDLKKEFAAAGLPEISIGIGVNTGTMNVGDMGSEFRRSYTVLGDAVNLASRLEGVTKYYGVRFIVGEQTYQQARDAFVFRHIDRMRVKGKADAVDVYEPLCRKGEETAALLDELATYEKAMQMYRERRWNESIAAIQALLFEHPNTALYQIYRKRIEAYRDDPPHDDWDGVYELQTK